MAITDNRKDTLDLAIGLVIDKYGSNQTYESLAELLQVEFPSQNYTLDELYEFYALVMAQEELNIYLSHINDEECVYQY